MPSGAPESKGEGMPPPLPFSADWQAICATSALGCAVHLVALALVAYAMSWLHIVDAKGVATFRDWHYLIKLIAHGMPSR